MGLLAHYIDNFETKALDAIRDLPTNAQHVDIAVAFLSFPGSMELKPSRKSFTKTKHSSKCFKTKSPPPFPPSGPKIPLRPLRDLPVPLGRG